MKSIAICLFLIGLFAATAVAGEETSVGIYFDHALHAEQDLECDACHEAAWTSRLGSDWLLPEKDTCADCHDVDDDESCGMCHVDPEDPVGFAETESKVDLFSHAAHVGAQMECGGCHGADLAMLAMPAKSECRSCHVTASDLADCSLCHTEGAEYVPASHGPMWEAWHGVEAGHDAQSCANCHAQVDCQDCHAGDNVRPRSHRLNFAFDHSVEARAGEAECATCHFEPSFCNDCHAGEGIIPSNHFEPGWTGNLHGVEALLEMESCISCHETGTGDADCAVCHGR